VVGRAGIEEQRIELREKPKKREAKEREDNPSIL